MNEQSHIINKVFLEVNTSSQKSAFVIKDNVNSFLESELFPKLEILLDKYNVQNSIVRFDELHLEVAVDNWGNKEQLKEEITGLMEKKLQAMSGALKKKDAVVLDKDAEGKFISPDEKMETVFLYFLENGRLPWFGNREHIQEISRKQKWQQRMNNKHFVEKLNKILIESTFAIRRFVMQFSEKMVFDFVIAKNQNISKSDVSKIQQLAGYFSKTNQKLFLQFWMETVVEPSEQKAEIRLQKLQQLISGKKTLSTTRKKEFKTGVIPVLKKIYPGFLKEKDWNAIFESEIDISIPEKTKDEINNSIEELNESLNERSESILDNGEELLVQNAGLILLHPFFKSFFEKLDFLDKKGQLLTARKEMAVQALHYLATGSEVFFEGNLLLEKFLCNVTPKWPFSRDSLLNEQIKNEADSLLKAAIKHWHALKNTSANGLRYNFLQRDGKLVKTGENHRLLVERKTQDILLERINWNISVVKLPWMKHLLHVEW